MKPELSIGYIAGFFDGEGCIGIYSYRHGKYRSTGMQVKIANTNPVVLLAIQERFGGKIKTRTPKGGNLPLYILSWDSAKALAVLKMLEPHLLVKKDQATLAIEFWENRSQTCRPGRRKPAEEIAAEGEAIARIARMKRAMPRLDNSSGSALLAPAVGTDT